MIKILIIIFHTYVGIIVLKILSTVIGKMLLLTCLRW